MAGTAIGGADNTEEDDADEVDAALVVLDGVGCALVVDLTELSRLNIAHDGQNERFEVDAAIDASAGAPIASLEGAETDPDSPDAAVDGVVAGAVGVGVDVDAVDVPVSNAIAFNSAALNSEDIVLSFGFCSRQKKK